MTVAVIEGSSSVVDVRDEDLSWRWYCATGAGGQHANRHHNSLELTHVPSGVSVVAQGRSRAANERTARQGLADKLKRAMIAGDMEAANTERSQQIGSGMRSDKRRTYRFRDDLVIDHETNKSARCADFMRGKIDTLWT